VNIVITEKLTKFAGKERDILVTLSRARFGLIIFIPAEIIDYNSYSFEHKADMLCNKVTRALYNIYSLALKRQSVF